jgi:hypothetical protein
MEDTEGTEVTEDLGTFQTIRRSGGFDRRFFRTGTMFCAPKGLDDSAWGFNPEHYTQFVSLSFGPREYAFETVPVPWMTGFRG